ncbi:unnamed protein product [Lactuca virosa]|uniref:Uncharacterized protein n=1 Tax=Lactuca virosa TaxID=75947 RepID=A0AAU9LF26_9ASTR|nr:unnamed protein product [Lactuca virosa]
MEPFHFFIMFLLLHLYNLLFRWCACHAARFFFQVNPLLDSEAKPVYAFKDASRIWRVILETFFSSREEMLKFDDLKNDNLATKTLDTTQVAMETLPLQLVQCQ